MVQTFVSSVPQVLLEMEQSLKDEDWEKVSNLAHKIKPTFTLMGLDDLKNSIVFIEVNGGKRTDLHEVRETTLKFIEECRGVIPELAKEVLA